MNRRLSKCAACGSPLAENVIRLHRPFSCPVCGKQLEVSSAYNYIICAALLLSMLVPLIMGVRGLTFFVVAAIAWGPIQVLLVLLAIRLFRPKTRGYDPIRIILGK